MSRIEIIAIFLFAFLLLGVVTFYRLVSGKLPDTKQDYGEGDGKRNDWEIK